MMPAVANPLALRRCPPGSAPSLHAYPPCAGVAILFFPPFACFLSLPVAQFRPVSTGLPSLLFIRPSPPHRTEAQSAIAQPEQNPLKADPAVKV